MTKVTLTIKGLEIIKELEHPSYEERLRELGVLRLRREGSWGIFSMCLNT